jgi:hypothetical protein
MVLSFLWALKDHLVVSAFLVIHEDLLSVVHHSQVKWCFGDNGKYMLFVYFKTAVLGSGTQHILCLLHIVFVFHSDNHVISIHVTYGRSRLCILLTAVMLSYSRGELLVISESPRGTYHSTFNGDPNSYFFSVKLCVTFQTQCMEEVEIKRVQFFYKL